MSRELHVEVSTPPPPPRRRRTNWFLWAPVIVFLLGLLAAIGGYVVAGGPGPIRDMLGLSKSSTTTDAKAETFTVNGYVTLTLGQFAWYSSDDLCLGIRSFDDIRLGTQIVVSDASSNTLGTGTFGVPEVVKDPGNPSRATKCRVPFAVNGVPVGHEFYGVQIGQRNKLSFNRFDIRQPLELTLD